VPRTHDTEVLLDVSLLASRTPVPARSTAPARKLLFASAVERRPRGRCQMKTCHAVRGTKRRD